MILRNLVELEKINALEYVFKKFSNKLSDDNGFNIFRVLQKIAIKQNNTLLIDTLINNYCDTFMCCDIDFIETTFLQVCERGNIETIKYFYKNYSEYTDDKNYQNKVLKKICEKDNLDVLKFLMKKFSNYEDYCPNIKKLFEISFMKEKLDTVKYLLDNFNIDNYDICHIIKKLYEEKEMESINFLIDNYPNIIINNFIDTYSDISIYEDDVGMELAKYLFEKLGNNIGPKNIYYILHDACIFGNFDMVNYIINTFTILDDYNKLNKAFYEACTNDNFEIARLLKINYPEINHNKLVQWYEDYEHTNETLQIIKWIKIY